MGRLRDYVNISIVNFSLTDYSIVSIHDFLAISIYFGRHFIERRALLSPYLHISCMESWILILFTELKYVLFCFCCSNCLRFGWREPFQIANWFIFKLYSFDMSSSFLISSKTTKLILVSES